MANRILVIGSTNTDMVVTCEHLPAPGETVLGGELRMFAGGKGANQAVAAARVGGRVSFMGAVGEDAFGKQSVKHLQSENVNTLLVKKVAGVASGVALITIDAQGENMITVAPGANHQLLPEDVADVPFEDFACVTMQLETPLETVRAAALRARAAGCRVILNPAPAAALPDELFAALDLLVPNRGELELLAGASVGDDEDSILSAAERLRERGVARVIVTLGAAGCLLADADGARRFPGLPAEAVDTVGAGDCFVGALAARLAEDAELADAIRYATAAAALSVQKPGAQDSLPRDDEVRRLLESS